MALPYGTQRGHPKPRTFGNKKLRGEVEKSSGPYVRLSSYVRGSPEVLVVDFKGSKVRVSKKFRVKGTEEEVLRKGLKRHPEGSPVPRETKEEEKERSDAMLGVGMETVKGDIRVWSEEWFRDLHSSCLRGSLIRDGSRCVSRPPSRVSRLDPLSEIEVGGPGSMTYGSRPGEGGGG